MPGVGAVRACLSQVCARELGWQLYGGTETEDSEGWQEATVCGVT